MPGRRQCGKLLAEFALLVEQFPWPVAHQPVFQLLQMFGILEIRNRNLMRAPGAFNRFAIDEFRSGPALWSAENDHRPARAVKAFYCGRPMAIKPVGAD